MTSPTLLDKTEASNGEKGTLTLITQRRIIRRAYLNHKIIPAQIDTCSLVSIVESNVPECNRVLKIGRKLGMHPLHWRNRWREESTKNNQAIIDIFRSEPHTPANSLRRDRRTTTETSEGPGLGIVCMSDDPRRGARIKTL